MAAIEFEPILAIPKLESLESTMSDISYREAIKNSSNFNARLTVERKHRIPFLDTQTGIAQAPSSLYFDARQRLPGLKTGQIYSYPVKRWRKKRRQYLSNYISKRKDDSDSNDYNVTSFVENPSVSSNNEDSKDSIGVKEADAGGGSKDAWFYDEMEMGEMDCFEEHDADSDFDYEDSYSVRMKKKKRSMMGFSRNANRSSGFGGESPTNRRGSRNNTGGGSPSGPGRGRRKAMTYVDLTDTDKPFACDLCGARYKTRPGLTYHYTHSHKEGTCADVVPRRGGDSSSSGSRLMNDEENSSSQDGPPGSPASAATTKDSKPSSKSSGEGSGGSGDPTGAGWGKFQDSYLTFLNSPGAPTTGKKGSGGGSSNSKSSTDQKVPAAASTGSSSSGGATPNATASGGDTNSSSASTTTSPTPEGDTKTAPATPAKASSATTTATSTSEDLPLPILKMEQNEKPRAKPSPYCDFCLGDSVNKKSGQPEDLVSCSDCGRSGHPTCLQFTNNMKVSVRKYRWQCIECKCCSICGTSDNDDQLLFCDDCDRGYHMYCLVPPIQTPPEGSWSCRLCIKEFHKK